MSAFVALWKTSKRGRHAIRLLSSLHDARATTHARAFLRHRPARFFTEAPASPSPRAARSRRSAARASPRRTRAAARRDSVRGARLDKVATPGHRGGGREHGRRVRAQGLSIPQPHREGRRVPARSGSLPRLRLAVGVPRGVRHRPEGPGAVSWSSVHPTWQKARAADAEDTHAGWAFAAEGQALASPSGWGSFMARTTK